MFTLQPGDTLDVTKPRNATGARPYRVLHNGTPIQVEATGKDRQFTKTAAESYRKRARQARDDALEATAAAERTTQAQLREQALAPQAVLDPAARRLDGLTHEQAVAKGYGKPMPRITYLGRHGRKHTFVFGTTAATYTVSSEAMHVKVVDTRTQDTLYSGPVAELQEKGNRSKNALALLPWMPLDTGVVERYLAAHTVQ